MPRGGATLPGTAEMVAAGIPSGDWWLSGPQTHRRQLTRMRAKGYQPRALPATRSVEVTHAETRDEMFGIRVPWETAVKTAVGTPLGSRRQNKPLLH